MEYATSCSSTAVIYRGETQKIVTPPPEKEMTSAIKAMFEQLLEAANNDNADQVCSIIMQQGLPSLRHAAQSGTLGSIVGQQGLTKLLHHAAQSGNIELMRIALDDPTIEVNGTLHKQGCTALLLACWKGHTEAATLLLLKGADVLLCTKDGLTCLHLAVFCGHTEVVNFLLHGRYLGKSSEDSLHMAAFCRDTEALNCLLNGKCLGEDQISALTRTYSKCCWSLIERKTGTEKFTALHMAAKQSHNPGVEIAASICAAFIASALDVYGLASNPKVEYNIEEEVWSDFLFQIQKELHLHHGEISEPAIVQNLAAYGNHGEGLALREKLGTKYEGLVHAFVELISYSNVRDKIGRTALHHSAWEDKAELVNFFMGGSTSRSTLDGPQNLQLGGITNVNVVDVDGHTPLHLASRNGCTKVVKELIRNDMSDHTPGKETRQVDDLLDSKETYLQPNATANPTGRSQEIAIGIESAVEKLLKNCNERLPRLAVENSIWLENRAGVTPLHYAVEKGHRDIVELLIKHPKTDVFSCASNGQSPWTFAFPKQPDDRLTDTQMAIQMLLRGDASPPFWRSPTSCKDSGNGSSSNFFKVHFQKLLRQATELAVAAENGLPQSRDNLRILERQILLSFAATLAHDQNYKRQIKFKVGRSNQTEASSLKDCNASLLHVAAYYGCGQEIEALLTVKKYQEVVNVQEELTSRGQTALHFSIDGGRGALARLLKAEDLNVTTENGEGLTPVDYVEQKLYNCTFPEATARKILTDFPILMDHLENKVSTYRFALNAMTVAASVVASATLSFGNNGQKLPYFNEMEILSFYYAIAVVISGVGAQLPSSRSAFIVKEVRRVRMWVQVSAFLFGGSIICMVTAFTVTFTVTLGRALIINILLLPYLAYAFIGRLGTWKLVFAFTGYISKLWKALVKSRKRSAILVIFHMLRRVLWVGFKLCFVYAFCLVFIWVFLYVSRTTLNSIPVPFAYYAGNQTGLLTN
ncbi:unnamed protein product [Calypogeia fissa]